MEKGKGAMSVTYLLLITTTNMLQTLPPSSSPNLVYKYLKIADWLEEGVGGNVCNRFHCITLVTSSAGDGSNPSGAKHIWFQMPKKYILDKIME